MIVSKYDCVIVAKQADAEVMIQPLCGVLATDHDSFLIGTPALPIPVPYCDINIVIPEIPIFKIVEMVNFSGTYVFYRRFEQEYGMTPDQYRKRNKN